MAIKINKIITFKIGVKDMVLKGISSTDTVCSALLSFAYYLFH